MELQDRVAEFMERNGMDADPEFRILDFLAEAGEIAGDAAKSSDYGMEKEQLQVREDEVGDALFSLLAVCNSLGIDAEDAVESSLEKYRDRIERKGDPGSR